MAGHQPDVNNYAETRQRLDSALESIEHSAESLGPALDIALKVSQHYREIVAGYQDCLHKLLAANTSDPRVTGLIETGKAMLATAERNRDYWKTQLRREQGRQNKLNAVRNELVQARNRLDVAQKLMEGQAHLASLAALGEPLPTAQAREMPEFREALQLAREAEALAELKEWR
ncbi:hypothetical protein D477_004501 [Arthrobacter crystallopoietes BAB-32]|uniref:Uncharacterized protein n=1 Tax=Arthrobacter crystallopoietes BAB-32 TaxID=1246476 RepID=N1V5P1_9MICC|nr:hypothetical protein [Arthrobacter crystallopoietes]EMY35407.1 hypothetical protein D477_004501 [Arthrobacter crystallopoietes BAB-32]